MNGYWDFMLPILQFLSIHTGYTLYWTMLLSSKLDIRKKFMTFVALGGLSAILHNDIIGAIHSILIHFSVVALLFILYFAEWVLKNHHIKKSTPVLVENLECSIEMNDQELIIINKINDLQHLDKISEPALEKIYFDDKDYIDSNAVIKTRIFNEVINWRRLNNIKCRVVTINGQRSFIDVNHRSVDWLK